MYSFFFSRNVFLFNKSAFTTFSASASGYVTIISALFFSCNLLRASVLNISLAESDCPYLIARLYPDGKNNIDVSPLICTKSWYKYPASSKSLATNIKC
ncbi:unknown [Tannerella sp. CAG:118]|nr:unknown [Tannerella sp. CAG:118]